LSSFTSDRSDSHSWSNVQNLSGGNGSFTQRSSDVYGLTYYQKTTGNVVTNTSGSTTNSTNSTGTFSLSSGDPWGGAGGIGSNSATRGSSGTASGVASAPRDASAGSASGGSYAPGADTSTKQGTNDKGQMPVSPGSALTPMPTLGKMIPMAMRSHVHLLDTGNARMHRKGPQAFQLYPTATATATATSIAQAATPGPDGKPLTQDKFFQKIPYTTTPGSAVGNVWNDGVYVKGSGQDPPLVQLAANTNGGGGDQPYVASPLQIFWEKTKSMPGVLWGRSKNTWDNLKHLDEVQLPLGLHFIATIFSKFPKTVEGIGTTLATAWQGLTMLPKWQTWVNIWDNLTSADYWKRDWNNLVRDWKEFIQKWKEDPEGAAGDVTGDLIAAYVGFKLAQGIGSAARAISGSEAAAEGAAAEGAAAKGGPYGEVRSGNKGGEVDHTPAQSVSPYSRVKGPSVWMEKPDHKKTASWGSGKEAQAYRRRQADLIKQGKLREAIQMDIDDIRAKFGSKYDENIRQMLAAFGFSE